MNDAASQFDPVTLEILWSRLISIADESAAALLRTSFSTIVRESNDFGTVLMDANGDGLSENTGGIPSFSGILPRSCEKTNILMKSCEALFFFSPTQAALRAGIGDSIVWPLAL